MKNDGIESLGFLLHDAARLLRRRFEERGRDMGLSSAQWRLLVRLKREGKASQARLAEIMEVEPISVSRLVDRMVEAGWVARQKDPADRRVNIVVPTPQARERLESIRGFAGEVYEQAMSGMPPEERAQLLQSLSTVIENLSTCEFSAGCDRAEPEIEK